MTAFGIPVLTCTIELPELIFASARVNNEIIKRVVREEMLHHWRRRIPIHFTQKGTVKYRYAKRQSLMRLGKRWVPYNYWKAVVHKSRRDLVKTGATEREMTHRARVTVAGAAEGGKNAISATLWLRFPFKGGTGRFKNPTHPGAVTIEVMRKEIQRFAADEVAEINKSVGREYTRIANSPEYRRRKKKIVI